MSADPTILIKEKNCNNEQGLLDKHSTNVTKQQFLWKPEQLSRNMKFSDGSV